ncbi:hypothetical protein BKA82DRAFT_176473 [Pisolithus tinctorius]|uniref:Uncharacterized protein n=1 Tax=Pisolithus tinctorius Marx 270 TaxID=870435 RepID=A0A0C3PY76_PISTI|nr:hypothetical protein BKA82DRAFT_176473 [Pisolithus tinctorius]KIO14526.1 hypothetical protein M404DRAFT_176473 [Pisolithus tinctorius Marx 270]
MGSKVRVSTDLLRVELQFASLVCAMAMWHSASRSLIYPLPHLLRCCIADVLTVNLRRKWYTGCACRGLVWGGSRPSTRLLVDACATTAKTTIALKAECTHCLSYIRDSR